MQWILTFDGGCTPNPGKGSCAYKAVCRGSAHLEVKRSWPMKGNNNTNNQAEWEALVTGLEELLDSNYNVTSIIVYGDSKLIIEQISGIYRVKSNKLRPYYNRWLQLRNKFKSVDFKFNHIYRELNTEMDESCKDAR